MRKKLNPVFVLILSSLILLGFIGLSKATQLIATSKPDAAAQAKAIKQVFQADKDVESAEYLDLTTGKIVSKNPRELRVSASTYKLFIARFILAEIASHKLSWTSPYENETIRDGITQMIVNSDNNFPEWVIATYGADTIEAYLKSVGYQGLWADPNQAQTSASDLTKVLQYYYLHRQNADVKFLLGLMKTQEFRTGIPAGTPSVVADKVGFIDYYKNDAGIVFAKRPYILVVMTNHQTDFSLVKQVTQAVENSRK
ncbi:serine hydrolase [Lactococcus insecticola]|uniref:Beta-lactamase class A catalytic domain-containing protein n=1 Tax=Pseudolactococcus insecticola TaxID=2709158 RepID=A0A6A0B4Y2_9LACT|nr:serine hydrolase [Lactococcus insecticola]GFH40066.1 hypothetical protein Hs20B_04640 [Lactococcus insecticola]